MPKRVAKYNKYIPKNIIDWGNYIPRNIVNSRFLTKYDKSDVKYTFNYYKINYILKNIAAANYITEYDNKYIPNYYNINYIFKNIVNYITKNNANIINTLTILKKLKVIIYVTLIILKINAIFQRYKDFILASNISDSLSIIETNILLNSIFISIQVHLRIGGVMPSIIEYTYL